MEVSLVKRVSVEVSSVKGTCGGFLSYEYLWKFPYYLINHLYR